MKKMFGLMMVSLAFVLLGSASAKDVRSKNKALPASASLDKPNPQGWNGQGDSARQAIANEARRKKLEVHQSEARERYLAAMTPEQRARAEEAERGRQHHLRAQDSVQALHQERMRLRLMREALAEKLRADSTKASNAVDHTPPQPRSKKEKKRAAH